MPEGGAIPYFQTHPYETSNSLSSGGPSPIGPRVREKNKIKQWKIHENSVMCNQFSLVVIIVFSHSMLIPCYNSMLIDWRMCWRII
jgi:hypothetical protein